MDNAICIGRGMVGRASMHSLGIDNFFSRSDHNVKIEDIHKYRYIFICLPTPTVSGKQNLDLIRSHLKSIVANRVESIIDGVEGDVNIIIIRSTILTGTLKKLSKEYPQLHFVHVPEFLTEATWQKDSEWPDLVVVGGEDEKIREEVAGIFRARFKGAEYILTDSMTSETIKYGINCYYALKVIYANQLFDFCERHLIPYETVKNAMYGRKWIGRNHLDIWHNGGRGAGGKCLEKDFDAFANFTNLPLLEYANKLNKGYLFSNPKDK